MHWQYNNTPLFPRFSNAQDSNTSVTDEINSETPWKALWSSLYVVFSSADWRSQPIDRPRNKQNFKNPKGSIVCDRNTDHRRLYVPTIRQRTICLSLTRGSAPGHTTHAGFLRGGSQSTFAVELSLLRASGPITSHRLLSMTSTRSPRDSRGGAMPAG